MSANGGGKAAVTIHTAHISKVPLIAFLDIKPKGKYADGAAVESCQSDQQPVDPFFLKLQNDSEPIIASTEPSNRSSFFSPEFIVGCVKMVLEGHDDN